MIFASFEFLFLFLPIFFGCYFLTPEKYRNYALLFFSWAFYAWWRVDFLALLVTMTTYTYLCARMMERAGRNTVWERRWMLIGIVGNLAALGYFKYANFIVGNVNAIKTGFGFHPMAWDNIILPIGLSFYILQSVSYLLDIRSGTVPVSRSYLNYAAYKAIFAQLIAGPIVRYAEVAEEMKQRHHSWQQFGTGSAIFMVGFAMKTALADTLSPLVAVVFKLPDPSFADSWIGAISYTMQLYFDFAGYSLMAIGLARMIGFHFPSNFHNPYLSGSIQEFWRRWHMTLSRFLLDYLYINLGGNRKGPVRTYVNLILVMAIGGLWHGSSWNFVAWGLLHGTSLAVHRFWSRLPGYKPMPYWLGNAITTIVVVIGWVVFRADDFPTAWGIWSGMFGLHGFGGVSDQLAWQMTPDQMWFIPIALAFVYLPLIRGDEHALLPPASQPFSATRLGNLLVTIGPLAGYLLAMILLYSRDAVPFLYFQF
jgi:alginate O-acetyltransferase complex protein AlgI